MKRTSLPLIVLLSTQEYDLDIGSGFRGEVRLLGVCDL